MIEPIYQPAASRYEDGMTYRRAGRSGVLLPASSRGMRHNFGSGQTFFEPGSGVAAFAWCILMALNGTFSHVWGSILREGRGASRKTVGVLVCGLAILIFSLVFPPPPRRRPPPPPPARRRPQRRT